MFRSQEFHPNPVGESEPEDYDAYMAAIEQEMPETEEKELSADFEDSPAESSAAWPN